MAEGDNYLAGVNAARQRARGAIRGRIDQTIDPMESAAEMDRLQGASVMQTTGQVDPGVRGVFQLAGGGGSAPVRTAVGGGEAPVTATAGPLQRFFGGGGGGQPVMSQPMQSSGQCQIINGRRVCPGSSSAVSQAPMMSSTVVSSAPVATTVMPQSSGPVEFGTDPDSLMRRAVQLGSEATGYGLGPAAQAGRAANESMRLGTWGMEQKQLDQRGTEFEEQKFVNREKAKAMASESALNYAMVGATKDTSSIGRFENRQAMAQEVFEGRANHNWYIDSVVSQYAASAGLQDKSQSRDRRVTPRPAVDTGLTPEQIRQEASREIYTGSIMYDLIRSNNGLRTLADTPNATLDADVSQPDTDRYKLRNSLGAMASSYAERGGFEGEFSAVQMRLMNDLRTLHGAMSTYFVDERRNNADYATLPAARRAQEDETAIQRGRDAAIAIQSAAMNQMQAWHGQYHSGTFNRNDPWAERTTGNPVGGVFPSVEFWTGRTVDSNDTLPPPKKAEPKPPEGKST